MKVAKKGMQAMYSYSQKLCIEKIAERCIRKIMNLFEMNPENTRYSSKEKKQIPIQKTIC